MPTTAHAALAALLLAAGCDEVPAGSDPDAFPFNAHVDVDAAAAEVQFVARVENATSRGEPDARFAVALYNGPVFVASGAAATGPVGAGESRRAAVAFSRGLVWTCFQWSVSTQDGRRRSSELIC
jgi:hypothetical protein